MFEKFDPDVNPASVEDAIKEKQGFTRKTQVLSYLTHNIPLEKKFQGDVIKGVKKAFPGAYVVKISLAHYSSAGIPDVMVIVNGHYFGFEIKRPILRDLEPSGYGPTKIQKATMEKMEAAGATCAVVSYPEEAIKIIQGWLKENGELL